MEEDGIIEEEGMIAGVAVAMGRAEELEQGQQSL